MTQTQPINSNCHPYQKKKKNPIWKRHHGILSKTLNQMRTYIVIGHFVTLSFERTLRNRLDGSKVSIKREFTWSQLYPLIIACTMFMLCLNFVQEGLAEFQYDLLVHWLYCCLPNGLTWASLKLCLPSPSPSSNFLFIILLSK